jgi:5'-nucleotidase
MHRLRWSGRLARVSLAVLGVATVVAAPLAVSTGATAAATTITGARSLNDRVVLNVDDAKVAKNDGVSTVHLLGFNDFHGNLEPAGLNIYGRFAGGAAYLAKAVGDRQATYGDRALTVLAGDNIGASPLVNSLFNEEPGTVVSNLMHVDFASVGNHEFDKGRAELLRIQQGGCKPDAGCTGAPYALAAGGSSNVYPGADFQYLAANVVDTTTGKTLLPAYGVKRFKSDSGKKFSIGVIGEVLKDTPTIVTPSGVAGLKFQDEADAANRAVRALADQGVKIPVLVIHQGGFQSGTSALNGCAGNLTGSPILDIASRLDPAVKIIISAHTHAEYRCLITTNGVTRLITSAASFGRILTDITLTVHDKSGELVAADAANVIVDNALNAPGPNVVRQADSSREDPAVRAVVNQYVTAVAPLANRVIGRIQGDLTRTATTYGESTLGDVIADAQLAATAPANQGSAVVAFMNPGGVRDDLLRSNISAGGEAPGEVTYGEAFTVQPFGNSLVTKTLTGAMIRRLLQQQFPGCEDQTTKRVLQISASLRYEQDPAAATCDGKIGRIWISGQEITAAGSWRVTMNNFLATGGDGFRVFNEGTDVLGGAQDIDAFVDWFVHAGSAGIAVPASDRIVAKA